MLRCFRSIFGSYDIGGMIIYNKFLNLFSYLFGFVYKIYINNFPNFYYVVRVGII